MKAIDSSTYFKANKMSSTQANYINEKLKKAKNVDIICHNMTDRDSANSALAMLNYLENQGINSRIIISQNKPEALGLRTYNFNIVQAKDNESLSKVKPDITFCVDFGDENKVLPNVLSHIKNSPKIMGFDHHGGINIVQDNFLQHKKQVKNSQNIHTQADFYSDMSAKSATSVVYRFFEALGEEINNSTAYDLFLGLIDDSIKRNLVKVDGIKGTIEAQEELIKDKNAHEIYCALREKLNKEQIEKIAKTIDVLSYLTPQEQAFKDSLWDKLNYSKNGKIAYLEITPQDKEWENLGGDNTITSRILNNFRQEILSRNENIEIAIVFYEAHGNYRLSAHSKTDKLLDFFKYVEENKIPNFTKYSGGHQDRAGGGINTIDPEKCHTWVQDIISCDKFFNKN